MNNIKTRVNFLPQILLIALGIFVGLPFFSAEKHFTFGSADEIFATIFLSLSVACIIIGLWKIERFTIKDGKFIKSNFLLLVRRKRELTEIIDIKNKNIDLSPLKYQWILTKKKYNKYRLVTVVFNYSKNQKIDERSMPKEDFYALVKKLDKQRKRNTRKRK